ncbi:MAG: radical SAM protein [Candidatus Wallbacteria bacterium]|nr:radical SAM protein [Candidatus Wallbacteria bacterium]
MNPLLFLSRLVTRNAGHFISGWKYPLAVSFSLTDRCQLSCPYCAIPSRGLNELSTSKVIRILESLKRLGCLRLGFTGGEPLLRDDISEIAEFACKQGFHLTLNSNGILLEEKKSIWQYFKTFFLSLEGNTETQKLLRGRPSTEEILRLIRKLVASGKKVITATVLCRENLEDVDFILEKASEIGFYADFELFSPHKLSGDFSYPGNTRLISVIERLQQLEKKGARIANSSANLRLLKKALKSGKFPRRMKCFAGKLSAFVDTDGSFYPCFDLREKIPPAQEFREIPPQNDYCSFCRCNGSLEFNACYSLYFQAILRNFKWW